MTITEKIISNCKKGLITIIQDDTENYMAFSNHKDYDGNYRTSSWVETIEETKRCIGETDGYSEKEIEEHSEEYNWKIVEVYREEVEPFNVGDKVRILPSIQNTDNWESYKEHFPDMKGEIGRVLDKMNGLFYGVYQEDGLDYWYIDHEYLAPLNEVEEDNVALEAIKVLEEKGYKIIKK